MLTLIIPFYNEERTLQTVLDRVEKLFSKYKEFRAILVDDGSIDKSNKIASKYAKTKPNIELITLQNNSGKTKAIVAAIPKIKTKYAIIQDADLEYNPEDIPKLLDYAKEKDAMAVYGSRNLKRNDYSYIHYYYGGKALTLLTNLFYGSKLTDVATGYKLLETDLLRSLHLQENGFDFCYEVSAKLLNNGVQIAELPISYKPRNREEGKKIKIKDGLSAVLVLVKYRFFR